MYALGTRLRQLLLAGSGLTFLGIGLAAIVFPHPVAQQYGFTLDAMAMNEFRAIVNGFWFGFALLMITAARRVDLPILGNLCAALILFQAGGRVLSFALDGVADLRFVAVCAGETLTGLGILLFQPKQTAP